MDKIVLLIFIVIILSIYFYTSRIFKKYQKIDIRSLMSGFEVARNLIDSYGFNDVYITENRSLLYSKYDSNRKVIRLSNDIFNSTSVTSCALSAREAVSCILDKKNDKYFKLIDKLSPLFNILIYIGYLVIGIGTLFGHMKTMWIGIYLEMIVFFFYVLTFKYENRLCSFAISILKSNKIITKKENDMIKTVLNASRYINFANIISPIILLVIMIVNFGKSK